MELNVCIIKPNKCNGVEYMQNGTKKETDKQQLYIDIGNRLKEIRKEKGYTQEKMAEILQVSTTFYGKVERGVNSLSLSKIRCLYEEMEIDITYLITGEKQTKMSFTELTKNISKEKQYDFQLVVQGILKLLD